MRAVPSKFACASDAATAGVLAVADWAAQHDLERTDRPEDHSVRWGRSRSATYVWCYPSGKKIGLELWLKSLPVSRADSFRIRLETWGALQPIDPRIPWEIVVAEWEDIRAFLDDYLAAWTAVRPGT